MCGTALLQPVARAVEGHSNTPPKCRQRGRHLSSFLLLAGMRSERTAPTAACRRESHRDLYFADAGFQLGRLRLLDVPLRQDVLSKVCAAQKAQENDRTESAAAAAEDDAKNPGAQGESCASESQGRRALTQFEPNEACVGSLKHCRRVGRGRARGYPQFYADDGIRARFKAEPRGTRQLHPNANAEPE